MMRDLDRKYDARTAITFLLAGLGLGALATLIMSPRSRPEVLATMQGRDTTLATSMFP
jgi:hypothetical protein